MTDLGTLGGTFSQPAKINNRGQVVGWSRTASDEPRAFLWQDGTIIDLGTLDGCCSQATDINDLGQVVGWSTISADEVHVFLWEDGSVIDLGTLPGGAGSNASAINVRGLVTGTGQTASGTSHAFSGRTA